MPTDWDHIKKQLLSGKKRTETLPFARGLSSSATMLDLACSDRSGVAWIPGTYIFMVGDSASGKTWIALASLAEAACNRHYDDYRLIYDGGEYGALMDLDRYFGSRLANRLQDPSGSMFGATWNYKASRTVEEFYDNLDSVLDSGKPCIYVEDSMDGLTTEEEEGKVMEQRDARLRGKEAAGSYGTSKAKINSARLRTVLPKLQATGSILIVVSQTRDNLGFGFEKKTRSGGHALRFYAHLEIWLSIKGKIKKSVKGKERQLGIICKAEVKKNRLTGRERTVEIPIYHSSGIDDTGSMITWLVDEKYWTKSGAVLHAPEFGFKGHEEKLIQQIEKGGEIPKLKELVAQVWAEIEVACQVQRERRYE